MLKVLDEDKIIIVGASLILMHVYHYDHVVAKKLYILYLSMQLLLFFIQGKFTIANLSTVIIKTTGSVGIWVFGLGFVAAALSSMLATTLGIGIITDGLFSIKNKECKDDKIDNETVEMGERNQCEQHIPSSDSRAAVLNEEASENYCENLPADRPFPVKYKNAAMIFSVVVGAAVTAANAPSIKVILIAQVTLSLLIHQPSKF